MIINIAIVDDHPIFANSLATLIDSYSNFNVKLIAYSGQELITKLRCHTELIDICIVDVIMPNMDGVQVASRLRENYPTFWK